MSKIVKFPTKNSETIEVLNKIIEKLNNDQIEDFFCSYLEKGKENELPNGEAVSISNDAFRLLGLLLTSMFDIYFSIKLEGDDIFDY